MPPLMSAMKLASSCGTLCVTSRRTADAVTVQPMVELHLGNVTAMMAPSIELCTRVSMMRVQSIGLRVSTSSLVLFPAGFSPWSVVGDVGVGTGIACV